MIIVHHLGYSYTQSVTDTIYSCLRNLLKLFTKCHIPRFTVNGVSGGPRHGLGANPPQKKMSLSPIVKHTGQELGGELWEIFKLWSFLQSKYVNNVCKLLQLMDSL